MKFIEMWLKIQIFILKYIMPFIATTMFILFIIVKDYGLAMASGCLMFMSVPLFIREVVGKIRRK